MLLTLDELEEQQLQFDVGEVGVLQQPRRRLVTNCERLGM